MSHHIYTTEAFILDSTPYGEADRVYNLLTKDLGLIKATAKGVRLAKSKLKASLQDSNYSKVSLVKGKEFWRITNAAIFSNQYQIHRENKAVSKSLASIFSLIKRLSGAEVLDEKVFEEIQIFKVAVESNNFSDLELANLELITVMRILKTLGYLPQVSELETFLGASFEVRYVSEIAPMRRIAVEEVNKALKQTQL